MVEGIHQKFVDSLIEAEKLWGSAEHFVNITYPVVKDSKLLVRALESLSKSVSISINLILKFEYIYRRINLSENKEENLECFFERCAVNYGLAEAERGRIKEILMLGRKHRESGFEFSKRDKAVIVDDELGTYELTKAKMTELLGAGRKLIESANKGFKPV